MSTSATTGSVTMRGLVLTTILLGCDDKPSVEDDEDGKPSAEDCEDGLDNDQDGLVDCEDGECWDSCPDDEVQVLSGVLELQHHQRDVARGWRPLDSSHTSIIFVADYTSWQGTVHDVQGIWRKGRSPDSWLECTWSIPSAQLFQSTWWTWSTVYYPSSGAMVAPIDRSKLVLSADCPASTMPPLPSPIFLQPQGGFTCPLTSSCATASSATLSWYIGALLSSTGTQFRTTFSTAAAFRPNSLSIERISYETWQGTLELTEGSVLPLRDGVSPP